MRSLRPAYSFRVGSEYKYIKPRMYLYGKELTFVLSGVLGEVFSRVAAMPNLKLVIIKERNDPLSAYSFVVFGENKFQAKE